MFDLSLDDEWPDGGYEEDCSDDIEVSDTEFHIPPEILVKINLSALHRRAAITVAGGASKVKSTEEYLVRGNLVFRSGKDEGVNSRIGFIPEKGGEPVYISEFDRARKEALPLGGRTVEGAVEEIRSLVQPFRPIKRSGRTPV